MNSIFLAFAVMLLAFPSYAVNQTLGGKPLSQVIAMLEDLSPATRRMAAYNLGTGGPGCASALPALRKTLNDPDQTTAAFAAKSIFQIDPSGNEDAAVDFLIKYLEAQFSQNARHLDQGAIEGLGIAGARAKRAVPLLQQIESSGSPGAQGAATRALAGIQGQ